MSVQQNIVKIKSLYYQYDHSAPIFKDLSFSINENAIISIIGSSGSGKSTLLNIIAGLIQPTGGDVTMKELNISYLTQTVTLLPYRTAIENTLLALELRGLLTENKINEAIKLFDLFDLNKSSLNKYPEQLSGGMKQRVGLIQTMLLDASLYLLDEPFTAIDRKTYLKIAKNIWSLLRLNGRAAVIVTHDIEQAVLLSDRIVLLNSNTKTLLKDILFREEFIAMSPEQRKHDIEFDKYFIEIIKSQNEE